MHSTSQQALLKRLMPLAQQRFHEKQALDVLLPAAKCAICCQDEPAEEPRPKVVAVDLDGTILDKADWQGEESFGLPRPGARTALRWLRDRGVKIIVWTCRGNRTKVEEQLRYHDIPFDGVNQNPDQPSGTSAKVMADVYVDDKAVNAQRPWDQILQELCCRLGLGEEEQSEGSVPSPSRLHVMIHRFHMPVPSMLAGLMDDHEGSV